MGTSFTFTMINLVLAGLLLAGFLGRFGWPFEIFTNIRPQIGFLLVVMGLYMLGLGRPVTALISLALFAVALATMLGQFRPAPPTIDEPALRIVWANILHDDRSFEKVVALAEAVEADLILLAEYDGVEAPVPQGWPHRLLPGSETDTDVALFSRRPLAEMGPMDLPHRNGAQAIMQTENGAFRFAGVHTHTPAFAGWPAMRNADIAAVMNAAETGPPMVVLGDFNTVAWSTAFRNAERDTAMRRVPYGPWSTWLSRLPFFGLPIDHVFIAPGLAAHVTVGPGIGSDHLPLIVDVSPTG